MKSHAICILSKVPHEITLDFIQNLYNEDYDVYVCM